MRSVALPLDLLLMDRLILQWVSDDSDAAKENVKKFDRQYTRGVLVFWNLDIFHVNSKKLGV